MIEGVLRHCTEMEVDRQYVDSHGQSVVAFAFTRLLGFQLLPRLKAIHAQRLYRPDAGKPDAYPRPAARAVAADRLGPDPPAVRRDGQVRHRAPAGHGGGRGHPAALHARERRSTRPTRRCWSSGRRSRRSSSPLPADRGTQARDQRRAERGRAVELANDFIFFARRGEVSSNRREDQELSMLGLHLLQNCMVYVNTLMVQQVLARPAVAGTADRARPARADTAVLGRTSTPTGGSSSTWPPASPP